VTVLSIINFLFFIVFNAILLVLPFNAWCEGITRPTNESSVPQLVIQLGHRDGIDAVAISNDGKYALSGGGMDSTLKLWDIQSGKEIRTFTGHKLSVDSVAFSQDSRYALSGSWFDNLKLWDIQSGKEIRTFTGDQSLARARSVTFSHDSRYALSGGGMILHLWEVQSGKEIRTFTGHTDLVNSVSFSWDSRYALSGSTDKTLKLWDIQTGKEVRSFAGHSDQVSSVSFSRDGRYALSGSYDKTMKLWDIQTGKELLTFSGHTDWIATVAFSPDGRYALSGSRDASIRLWDILSGKEIRTFKGHLYQVSGIAYSSDGRYILSGSHDNTAKLWESDTGKEIQTFAGYALGMQTVATSPDGRHIISGSGETPVMLKLWDLTVGREVRTFKGHSGGIASITFSPDGRYALTGSADKSLKLWDIQSGEEVRTFAGHAHYVRSVCFSSDSRYILSGGEDRTIKLWDIQSGKNVRTFEGHRWPVYSVALSPDGKHAISGSSKEPDSKDKDVALRLWDINTGKEEQQWDLDAGKDRRLHLRLNPEGQTGAYSVSFSPDGKYALAGTDDDTIIMLDLASRQELQRFKGHASIVTSVAFSKNGKLVLSGSMDKSLKLWDTETGKEIRTFTGHDNSVWSVAFSPDGKYAFSASDDKTTMLWDISSGRWLAKLISFTNDTWVVVDPEGRFDTNNLEDIKGLHWIMPDDPMQPLPLEIFMKDYYEPRLLPRILNGEQFNPVRTLVDLNRIRPQVKITGIEPDKSDPCKVAVTIEVSKAENEAKRVGRAEKLDFGIHDLKLFRDGQLVGYAPHDGGEIMVNALTGKKTISFPGIRLPRKKDIKEVLFSAYAFNADRIKSATDRKTYKFPENVKPVKGNAYIVTIGVNAYENPVWDLQYAGNDARKIQSVTHQRLLRTGQFANIVQIPLISDYEIVGDKKIIRGNLALKVNIQAVFELLAGKTVAYDIMKNIPNADKIKKAEPEDMILISFSGHGYVDKKGIFYAFPYDISRGEGREVTPELLNHLVSSDELTKWIRDVDGGEIVMIVDACHSAASVEGEGFKPGPMGSRGLGQLAYDKGMRILAASQADDVALESDRLKQGLLTYALVHDGIEAFQADFKPKDNKITLTEWLLYGVKRVPDLYEEVKKGNIQSFGQSEKSRGRVVNMTNDSAGSPKKRRVFQQPSLFDFMVKTGVSIKEVLLSDIQRGP